MKRANHHTTLLCEIDKGARAVLADKFPDTEVHDDVTTLARLPEGTDLVVAGFPCQDLSQAGKTTGIAGSRSGLVGEVFRLLRQQRVPWVLLENVPFMLQLAKGKAMEVIVEAMEELGYRWAYRVVDSLAFGVPQRRQRVLFLASLDHDPRDVLFADDAGEPAPASDRSIGDEACGFYWTEGIRGLGWAKNAVPTLKGGSTVGIPSSPAILLPKEKNVITPDIRDAERMQGFAPDWTAAAEQVTRKGHRWKLVGNAVTVDVAAWVGKRLADPDASGRTVTMTPLAKGAPWPKAAYGVRGERFSVAVSSWPVAVSRQPLVEFLRYERKPLSAKATRGFYQRMGVSSLRFPEGFREIIEAHLASMEQQASPPEPQKKKATILKDRGGAREERPLEH